MEPEQQEQKPFMGLLTDILLRGVLYAFFLFLILITAMIIWYATIKAMS